MSDPDLICLDKKSNTTGFITQEKPIIESQAGNKFRTELFLPEGERRKMNGVVLNPVRAGMVIPVRRLAMEDYLAMLGTVDRFPWL